ncbi:protein-L-isoaspartate(D-aspartate) O-methyltransferase [Nonomuraea pusilla]|uniref:protein-L-isoaspartate(D-aspartate) O-methyltransferase n=1 Tax=Nonomuraea pusilla TaxID=46177 RepID=UPI003326F0F9
MDADRPGRGMTATGSPQTLARDLQREGVRDERLLEAVRTTPRADFVPAQAARLAYDDAPLPIGHGQVTTQPSLTARMIEGLGLRGGERVLEVGTGLGFQTALLARLAAHVVTVELWPDFSERARRSLALHGIANVEAIVGDGGCGAPERGPYDAVLVSAAFPEVPAPLVEQLRVGGRLVQPIGPGGREEVVLFERAPDGLRRREVLTPARFVRLHGRYGYP